jgi:hypothetical protein
VKLHTGGVGGIVKTKIFGTTFPQQAVRELLKFPTPACSYDVLPAAWRHGLFWREIHQVVKRSIWRCISNHRIENQKSDGSMPLSMSFSGKVMA